MLIGIAALYPLVNTGSIGLLFMGLAILTVGLGLTYGPQAALYSELFPASVRFSGVSISYAIGAIIGAALMFVPHLLAAIPFKFPPLCLPLGGPILGYMLRR